MLRLFSDRAMILSRQPRYPASKTKVINMVSVKMPPVPIQDGIPNLGTAKINKTLKRCQIDSRKS